MPAEKTGVEPDLKLGDQILPLPMAAPSRNARSEIKPVQFSGVRGKFRETVPLVFNSVHRIITGTQTDTLVYS
jgi:hypothetical protein